jgi:uncharacterized membrane protein YqjE
MLGKLRVYMATVGVIGLVLLVLLAITVDLGRLRTEWALVATLGVLRLLSTGAPLSPGERQEMLEMADRQGRRLRTLIEQLLLAAPRN